MASITSFFRKTPVPSLKAYFATKLFTLPATVTWTGTDSDVVDTLIAALDTFSEADREALILEITRIMALADEPGQNALLAVVSDRVAFDTIEGGHNRALWVLMNEHANFQLAEDVRYNDEKRRGRMWQGFVVEKYKPVRKDQVSRDALTAEIQKKFNTSNVHVDVFDRYRVTLDGASHQLVQVAVYREGRPDDALGFDSAGKLQRHLVKPVYEASLTYEPSEGVIEVVAGDKDVRMAMASMMGRTLMDIDFKGEILPAREYDLGVLMEPFDFPTDPRAPADQVVEKVQVRELRFQPLDRNGQRVTLECDGLGGETIWDMADNHIAQAAQRRADWVITRARLVVKFVPYGKSRRARSLNLTITVPHGCNLKGMTPAERLVGEKYLRDWGILKGKPEVVDGADRS
jgi:hypothetical protein